MDTDNDPLSIRLQHAARRERALVMGRLMGRLFARLVHKLTAELPAEHSLQRQADPQPSMWAARLG